MPDWNYGDAYKRFPLSNKPYQFKDGSIVQVHDIMDPLPDFMLAADMLFIDPPWNKGNLSTFYTKADIMCGISTFDDFYTRLFDCIKEINPKICYIEIGKEHLADFILNMKSIFKYVTFYNSTYYHHKDKRCYVIRGSDKFKKPPLDNMDEEDIIKWICEHETYRCIGDLCMGRGLVGYYAHTSGHKFVGTELNHKRLSVLIERISGLEMQEEDEEFTIISLGEWAKRHGKASSTVRDLVRRGRLPAARKIGRNYVINEHEPYPENLHTINKNEKEKHRC